MSGAGSNIRLGRAASICLILAVGLTMGLLICAQQLSTRLGATAVPAARYWVAIPLILLMTIFVLLSLQLLLTPCNSKLDSTAS
jgi:hypothetical protein